MNEKLISIIIPIYKVEKYLDRCVGSITEQTYKNLEIILVDDGSPDNCPAICDEWAKKDSRIRVVHKENGGLSDARNAGMKIATGEYIGFVDSDDWIEENFCAVLAEQLDNGADIAECATRLCDENNITLLTRGLPENTMISGIDATKALLSENGIMQTVWNKLYKKELVIGKEFKKGKDHEDNFWTWRIFLEADKVFVSNLPMYDYVQRKGSIMGTSYSLKRLDGLEAVYECFCELKDNAEYRDIMCRKLITSCIYNYQSSQRYLCKEDKMKAKKIILGYVKGSGIKAEEKSLGSIWQRMFLISPSLICRIRNILKIGL